VLVRSASPVRVGNNEEGVKERKEVNMSVVDEE
jgi:hypothetical protein